MAIRQSVLCGVFFLVTACQPAGTAAPATTAAPTLTSAPTHTPVPPSATVPPPTLPPPTRTPTELPNIPTPSYTPTDIVGIWTRTDPDRGNLFITLSESGSYSAAHGTPSDIVHAGSFNLEGALFTFVSGWNCSPMDGDVEGQYILRHQAGEFATFISFRLYQDDCPDRPEALDKYRWDKYTE